MAKEYRLTVPAHPNVYDEHIKERQIDIIFIEPEMGITENTGLLLLIPGYGETMDATYLKEARLYMSDLHDVVVVQSSYFGDQFMQDSQNARYIFDLEAMRNIFTEKQLNEMYDGISVDMRKFIEIANGFPINIEGTEVLNESISEFNDMGLMQALDQLSAVYSVKAILKDNGYSVNPRRIFAYGQGHGAYLCYLCNALAPQLFDFIVDNSSWLFPPFIRSGRVVGGSLNLMTFSVTFDYMAGNSAIDFEFLNLSSLYKQFRNTARIIAFHGGEDSFLDLQLKKEFSDSIKLCTLQAITEEALDGDVFKSQQHGLGADYAGLFNYAVKNYPILGEVSNQFNDITRLETKSYDYHIDLSGGMPLLTRIKKRKRP